MTVRVEPLMQQPAVCPICELRFWNPRAVCDDKRRRDEAATNRFLVEIFTIRQNDHLLGSWVEHAKAVWVKPFLLAEVEYRAKSAHGKLRHPSLKT